MFPRNDVIISRNYQPQDDEYYTYREPEENVQMPENQVPPSINENSVDPSDNSVQEDESLPVDQQRRYPERIRKKPKHLNDFVNPEEDPETVGYTIHSVYKVLNIPVTYREAISSDDSDEWHQAMTDEMASLKENKTFELAPRPTDKSVIGGKWVYSVKTGLNNEQRFKARYVAKGYSQVESIDYHETFSPTAKLTSVRMLMQTAVQEDLLVHQMDVKTAYLNAEIDCEIFVEQPPGFVVKSDKSDLVLKLKRSLYGLRQSGRNWNHLLHSFLINLGFEQSLSDNCVYSRNDVNGKVIMMIYVDDLIIAASCKDILTEIKSTLSSRFKMKDFGTISYFLGIEFKITENCIEMNQCRYAEKILSKFNMSNCKPKAVPCDLNINNCCLNKDSKELEDPRMFREIIGNLLYLMTCTRPDICFAVSKLSQFLSKPTYEHLNLSKTVLKYLKGTVNHGLKFVKSEEPLQLIGYCDSDWGSSTVDRRSISGYCFKLSNCGSLISWRSKKQPTVALSTCEAEYIALTFAIQEGKFVRSVLCDLLNNELIPINLYCDNQGSIKLAKNPINHQRSKHIDIRYHYIRTEVTLGNVFLHYIPSGDNVADIYTKPVSKNTFEKFRVVSDV